MGGALLRGVRLVGCIPAMAPWSAAAVAAVAGLVMPAIPRWSMVPVAAVALDGSIPGMSA
jgi:hypothetical protein